MTIPLVTFTVKLYVESQVPLCVTKRRSQDPSYPERAYAAGAKPMKQLMVAIRSEDLVMIVLQVHSKGPCVLSLSDSKP